MAGLSRQDCFASIPGRVGSRQYMSAAPCAALFVSALLSIPLLYGVDIICFLPFVFFYFLPGHYMRKYKIGIKKLGLRAKINIEFCRHSVPGLVSIAKVHPLSTSSKTRHSLPFFDGCYG